MLEKIIGMNYKIYNEAISEAKRSSEQVPFIGTAEEYVKEYLKAKEYARHVNLMESEPVEFIWNKVLLKTETVGGFRTANIPSRESMLLPWFRQGDACMLYAPAGLGKSFLSMTMGLAVAGSGEIKGLDWKAEDKRKVLLVDGEMPRADLKDRIENIINGGWIEGLDQDAANENFRLIARLSQNDDQGFIDLTKPESQQLIGSYAVREGVKLVILDNFSTLTETMREENDATSFRQLNAFISKLKRKGISVLLIHHANKEGFAARGSSALNVTFDSIIGMHRVQTQPDDGVCFRLAFEKMRATPSRATATREVTMTSFGYSTGDQLEADANLKTVVSFVQSYTGKPLSLNSAAKEHIGLNRETIQKKLAIALTNGMLSAEQVTKVFSHLPAVVLNAVEETAQPEF
jgi:hypothetical protein